MTARTTAGKATSNLAHIGWWSERNGFTPTRSPEAPRVVRFMRERGDQPVYIKRNEANVSSPPSEPLHLT